MDNKKVSYILTKKFLYRMYIKDKLTTTEISAVVGCHFSTICTYLKYYGINIRKRGNFKDGRTLKNYYCHDCGKICSYKAIRCLDCHYIFWRGSNVSTYKTEKHKCIDCSAMTNIQTKRCNTCNKVFLKSKVKQKNPNWKNGISKLPYSFSFSIKLKKLIRNRDKYQCRNCKLTEQEHLIIRGTSLNVHHIDYNKENCDESNLITLCSKCNSLANGNRDYWYAYYTYLMELN